ncbi:MAG: hypothetical protein KZQ96_21045 [Candidatus Thiodiazotropha sp. (ex Lucinoma borealis)]|nr:hypothetical protein [Candidatus Thiodiazotropha sp. (ex Lucinoma borealis)]
MHKLKATEGLFKLARGMLEELWDHRLNSQRVRKQSFQTELRKIDRKIEQLLDRLVDTESATIINSYEKRIEQLEKDKLVISERITNSIRPVRSFEETVRTSLEFLANPHKLWASGRLEDQRAVLKLAFANRLAYVRNEGLRTPETTLPFKVLGGFSGGKSEMARPEGFEPPTP